MERGATEYSQSGLPPSYPAVAGSEAEAASIDQQPTAQYQPAPEVRPANFSSSGTPTSEYGMAPSSARSSTFPEYVGRGPYPDGAPRYHPPVNQSGAGADPAIAATSPTYPPPAPYSPYPPQGEMASPYQGHPGPYPRPEWGGYPPQHPHGLPPAYGGHTSPSTTVSSGSPATNSGQRPQVYSFVPIPGAQQHKRPRRRYEEIERMYKCGWNGCEKAYGTLNHLNAHVTMQGHGTKRTPEEFKEIRKEWKARKKDEENQRKAEEERARAAAAAQGGSVEGPPNAADPAQASSPNSYGPGVRPQLPPIAFAPGQAAPVQQGAYAPANGIEQVAPYGNNAMYSGYPPSPYAQQGGQVYQQHPDGPPHPPNNYHQQ